jgi:glycosyltransferase involved in cell wall biosynthesis
MFDALNSLPLDTTQSNRVVTVCESRDHKGVDLLVEAWPDVRSVYPEAELHVIGQGHPETYADTDGVRVRGFVQDLVEEYAHAEVYVHPARRDAFGVSVVEAMLGGAIPIVTETTGAREVVQAVDPNLISKPSVTDLTDTLIEVMGAKTSQKRAWRSESRQQATAYTANNKRAEFERRFETLLSRIGSSPSSVDGNN